MIADATAFEDYVGRMARGLDVADHPEADAFENLRERYVSGADVAPDLLAMLCRLEPENEDVALKLLRTLIDQARGRGQGEYLAGWNDGKNAAIAAASARVIADSDDLPWFLQNRDKAARK